MSTPLQEWQDACAPVIADLLRIADKRRQAMADLAKMGDDGIDLQQLLDESMGPDASQMGPGNGKDQQPVCDDTTHQLENTLAFLDIANRLCTDAGIKAIAVNLQEVLNGVKNLQMMDAAFVGENHAVEVLPNGGNKQFVDQAGAWSFLENNCIPYIQNVKANDEAMRAAGY